MNGERNAIAIPSYQIDGINGPYFGDLVFKHLEDEYKGKFERIGFAVKQAADGSEEAVTVDSVRGRTVYVIHPLVTNPAQHVAVAEEISDNLHRSDASSVVLMDLYDPYFSYDKRKGKQSLNARIVADKYAVAHVDRVFTVEPHTDTVALAFGLNCPLEPLPMQIPLARHFRESYELENVTVCSPDIGGYPRAEVFADLLGTPLIGIRKRRSTETTDETKVLEVVGKKEDVEGRMILFRDDVIRTAGSIMDAQKALDEMGAAGYYVVAPHLSLVSEARNRIKNSKIKKVIGTNTVHQGFGPDETDKYDVLDISPIIADVIYRRSEGLSIGHFFESFGNPKKS